MFQKIVDWFENVQINVIAFFHMIKNSKKEIKDLLKVVGSVLLIIFIAAVTFFLIAVGPLIVIWALNTLFPTLSIPYNFLTWLAVMIVCNIWRNPFRKSEKEKKADLYNKFWNS